MGAAGLPAQMTITLRRRQGDPSGELIGRLARLGAAHEINPATMVSKSKL